MEFQTTMLGHVGTLVAELEDDTLTLTLAVDGIDVETVKDAITIENDGRPAETKVYSLSRGAICATVTVQKATGLITCNWSMEPE